MICCLFGFQDCILRSVNRYTVSGFLQLRVCRVFIVGECSDCFRVRCIGICYRILCLIDHAVFTVCVLNCGLLLSQRIGYVFDLHDGIGYAVNRKPISNMFLIICSILNLLIRNAGWFDHGQRVFRFLLLIRRVCTGIGCQRLCVVGPCFTGILIFKNINCIPVDLILRPGIGLLSIPEGRSSGCQCFRFRIGIWSVLLPWEDQCIHMRRWIRQFRCSAAGRIFMRQNGIWRSVNREGITLLQLLRPFRLIGITDFIGGSPRRFCVDHRLPIRRVAVFGSFRRNGVTALIGFHNDLMIQRIVVQNRPGNSVCVRVCCSGSCGFVRNALPGNKTRIISRRRQMEIPVTCQGIDRNIDRVPGNVKFLRSAIRYRERHFIRFTMNSLIDFGILLQCNDPFLIILDKAKLNACSIISCNNGIFNVINGEGISFAPGRFAPDGLCVLRAAILRCFCPCKGLGTFRPKRTSLRAYRIQAAGFLQASNILNDFSGIRIRREGSDDRQIINIRNGSVTGRIGKNFRTTALY